MKGSYIGQAWLAIALASAFGAALAGVHAGLGPRIAANRLNDTLSQIPALVPGAAKGEPLEVAGRLVYRAVDAAGAPVGWVVPAGGQGFADRIELLIGLDRAADRITGLYILQQNETPGLGNRVAEDAFRNRFRDQAAGAPLRVVKGRAGGAGEIEAVTGATVSSDSVTAIVTGAAARFRRERPDAP